MAKKRYRSLTARPGEMKLGWGREDRHDALGVMAVWGDGVHRGNGLYLLDAICHKNFGPTGEIRNSITEELVERGFDISTLKIQIQKKPE